jgi:hypothetical protein
MMRFVLVHSPAVGPMTWEPVAGAIRRRGHTADVPDLAADGPIESWRGCVEAVRRAMTSIEEPVVLAGHSNAGLLLPAIAEAVSSPVAAFVFVDSDLPTEGSSFMAPPWFMDQLRSMAVDGWLPPWSTWFGEDAMRDLVPDEEVREAIMSEVPSLPLTYFEEGAPVPAGWDDAPCSYLLFSPAYVEAAEAARRRGWPVEELHDADHLHMVVDPEGVADALITLSR